LNALALGPLLAVLNHLLGGQPWLRERLVPFAGRVARLQSFPLDLLVSIAPDGRLAPAGREAQADATVEVSAIALLLLAVGEQQARAQVTLSGDAALGSTLEAVLRSLAWDAEEDLSRVLGDIAARRLAQAGRSWIAWQRRLAGELARALGEYLTEERPVLVERAQAQRWIEQVQALRDDVERLEQRLARLETSRRATQP
jgi:ubiquinone biosynthesis protein UbiJ